MGGSHRIDQGRRRGVALLLAMTVATFMMLTWGIFPSSEAGAQATPFNTIIIEEDVIDNSSPAIVNISDNAPFCGDTVPPAANDGDPAVCVNDDIAMDVDQVGAPPGGRIPLFTRINHDVSGDAALDNLVLTINIADGDSGLWRFTAPDPQTSLATNAQFTVHEFFTSTGNAGSNANLDRVAGVREFIPLPGDTVYCGVVKDSDPSSTDGGAAANIQGAYQGTLAFRILAVTLTTLTIDVLPADTIPTHCGPPPPCPSGTTTVTSTAPASTQTATSTATVTETNTLTETVTSTATETTTVTVDGAQAGGDQLFAETLTSGTTTTPVCVTTTATTPTTTVTTPTTTTVTTPTTTTVTTPTTTTTTAEVCPTDVSTTTVTSTAPPVTETITDTVTSGTTTTVTESTTVTVPGQVNVFEEEVQQITTCPPTTSTTVTTPTETTRTQVTTTTTGTTTTTTTITQTTTPPGTTTTPPGTTTTPPGTTTTPPGTTTTPPTTTSVEPTTTPTTPPPTRPTDTVPPPVVPPGGDGPAFTGVENVIPLGAIAVALMTVGSGLLWAGARFGKRDEEDQD